MLFICIEFCWFCLLGKRKLFEKLKIENVKTFIEYYLIFSLWEMWKLSQKFTWQLEEQDRKNMSDKFNIFD